MAARWVAVAALLITLRLCGSAAGAADTRAEHVSIGIMLFCSLMLNLCRARIAKAKHDCSALVTISLTAHLRRLTCYKVSSVKETAISHNGGRTARCGACKRQC
jgi:hypothetical protein